MKFPENAPIPDVSHAFLIDPRTGIVHLVDCSTARACCAPKWAKPPLDWVAFSDPKQPRCCADCLKIAAAMADAGVITPMGVPEPELEGVELDVADPKTANRFGRGYAKGPAH